MLHAKSGKLNSDKCKELIISFVKNDPKFAPIMTHGKELKRVRSTSLSIRPSLTFDIGPDYKRPIGHVQHPESGCYADWLKGKEIIT